MLFRSIGAAIMAGYRLMEGRKHAYTPAILALASIAAILILLNFYDINIKNTRSQGEWIGVLLAALAVTTLLIAVFWSLWRIYKIDETRNGVMIETDKTTPLVFIILLGAAIPTAASRAFGGDDRVREFLSALSVDVLPKFVLP